jgi:hypothetical protein
MSGRTAYICYGICADLCLCAQKEQVREIEKRVFAEINLRFVFPLLAEYDIFQLKVGAGWKLMRKSVTLTKVFHENAQYAAST